MCNFLKRSWVINAVFPVKLHLGGLKCYMSYLHDLSSVMQYCFRLWLGAVRLQRHSLNWYWQSSVTPYGGSIAHLAPLKTKGRQFDNFVVTGGTVSCRNDNFRCHQIRQCCQFDNLLLSVHWTHFIVDPRKHLISKHFFLKQHTKV